MVNQCLTPEDKFPSKASSCLDNLQFASILWNWAKRVQSFIPGWFKQTASQYICVVTVVVSELMKFANKQMKLKLGFKEKQEALWDISQIMLITDSGSNPFFPL